MADGTLLKGDPFKDKTEHEIVRIPPPSPVDSKPDTNGDGGDKSRATDAPRTTNDHFVKKKFATLNAAQRIHRCRFHPGRVFSRVSVAPLTLGFEELACY